MSANHISSMKLRVGDASNEARIHYNMLCHGTEKERERERERERKKERLRERDGQKKRANTHPASTSPRLTKASTTGFSISDVVHVCFQFHVENPSGGVSARPFFQPATGDTTHRNRREATAHVIMRNHRTVQYPCTDGCVCCATRLSSGRAGCMSACSCTLPFALSINISLLGSQPVSATACGKLHSRWSTFTSCATRSLVLWRGCRRYRLSPL